MTATVADGIRGLLAMEPPEPSSDLADLPSQLRRLADELDDLLSERYEPGAVGRVGGIADALLAQVETLLDAMGNAPIKPPHHIPQ